MNTDIDDRLREAHARIQPGPAPASTRARLDTLIAGAPPESRRPTRPRRGALAVIVTGTAAAGIVVLALLAGSGGVSGPPSANAACASPGPARACGVALRDVAGAWDVPGSGDVLYQRGSWAVTQFIVTATPADDASIAGVPAPNNEIRLAAAKQPFAVARIATEQWWIAPDASGRMSHSPSAEITVPTSRDRAAWQAAGRPDLEQLIPSASAERPLSTDFAAGGGDERLLGANGLYDVLPHDGDPLAGIPRQPSALAAWLQERSWQRRGKSQAGCDGNGDGCSFAIRRLIDDTIISDIETLLAYPATPPALRASLVSVLTERSGTRSLGLIRDLRGRQVAAVTLGAGMHDGDGSDVIAFDPTSGELRAIGNTADGGDVRWTRTYAIVSQRVGDVGDTP